MSLIHIVSLIVHVHNYVDVVHIISWRMLNVLLILNQNVQLKNLKSTPTQYQTQFLQGDQHCKSQSLVLKPSYNIVNGSNHIPHRGNFRGTKFSQMAPKMKIQE